MSRAIVLALATLSGFFAPAYAAGLKATQTVEVVTVEIDADGNETLTYAPATEVEPGEQVRYSLVYLNDGTDAAENVSLVMPIPNEVTYLEASAAGEAGAVTFSADGGQSFVERDALFIGDGDATRLARAGEITHIRWDFEAAVAPSGSGSISYTAVLK